MQRDAGSVRMTSKGRALLAQAREVIKATDGVIQIAARPDLIEDRLRLGVTEMVASTWLRLYLRKMKEVYPKVVVEPTIDLSRNLDAELAANALDLTIQTAPFSTQATGEIALGSCGFVWVAAPEIAAWIGDAPGVADLLKYPILTHARYTQSYSDLSAFFDGYSPRARLVPSSSLTSVLHMTQDAMGIGVVPHALVARQIAKGTLVEIAVGWRPSPLEFAARFHAEKSAGFVTHAADLAVAVSEEYDASQEL
jgi:DNA-binding transcriptional LysR family regulator